MSIIFLDFGINMGLKFSNDLNVGLGVNFQCFLYILLYNFTNFGKNMGIHSDS